MKKIILVISMILIMDSLLFAHDNFEPGVILLQLKNPDITSISQNKVINGSAELQTILQVYSILASRKLSHVNSETDGWYRIEFPLTSKLDIIRKELSSCSDVRYVTLNYSGIMSSIPNSAEPIR